jgi:hypothetical protein
LANPQRCFENVEIPGVPRGCRGRESFAIRDYRGSVGAPEAAHAATAAPTRGSPPVQQDDDFDVVAQADPLDAQGVERCAQAGKADRDVRL